MPPIATDERTEVGLTAGGDEVRKAGCGANSSASEGRQQFLSGLAFYSPGHEKDGPERSGEIDVEEEARVDVWRWTRRSANEGL